MKGRIPKKPVLVVLGVSVILVLGFIVTANAQGPVTDDEFSAKREPAVSLAAAAVTPIPWEGDTSLPPYIGEPAKAHPLPPTKASQNPFFAPNPFSNYHNDTWMSDTYDIAGPLGRAPKAWSSNLAAALKSPETTKLFHCGTLAFDSHGRIVTICSNSVQTTAVLMDPDSLEVLTYLDLPKAGGQTAGLGAGYMMLDNLDRAWSPIGDQIVVVKQTGGPDHTTFSYKRYDLSSVVPAGDAINSLVPDFKGRIWFVVRYSGIVGVLDPDTGSVQQLRLGEEISNSFAMDGMDAYIVTTVRLYRLTAGDDNVPHMVWAAPEYQNIHSKKDGQLSAGSGTTPTLLDHGKYVAIADNANQTHVVVYRTAEQLGPKKDRVVCEAPVFDPGAGAVEDSLVGSGRSLIVSNNDGYTYDLQHPEYQTVPGVARVDIDRNGKNCDAVWTNSQVNPASYGAKLSTKTGLIYIVAVKLDPSRKSTDYPEGVTVWYWTAIDFRTGETVWEQLAGTGRWFDGYWPLSFIGPKGALYTAGNGGIFAVRDTR